MLACSPYSERDTLVNIVDWIVALAEDWQIGHLLDVITTNSALTMLGIYSFDTFPDYYNCGQCANQGLQRVVKTEVF